MTRIATIAFLLTLAAIAGEAHKPITSPYTYNEHVFPILRERCGGCHFEGGPAPIRARGRTPFNEPRGG